MQKKKIAIWGTGGGATIITGILKDIDFYIENDKSKCNKFFLGKKVYYSKDITNWKEIVVHIYPRHYDEISLQLQGIGLIEGVDYYKFDINMYSLENSIDNEICELEEQIAVRKQELKESVFFFASPMFVRERNKYINWFNKIFEKMQTERFVIFSNHIEENLIPVVEELKCSVIGMPKFWNFYQYPTNKESIDLKLEIKNFFEKEKQLNNVSRCIRGCYKRMQPNYEYVYVYSVYVLFTHIIEILQPKCVIMWASLSPTHNILNYVCKRKGIKVYANHEGPLYGTWWFDPCGEHGESLPVTRHERFAKLPLSEMDIYKTQKILHDLKMNKRNRRLQPTVEDNEELNKLKKDWPTVTFLGDDDFGMCLVPPSERTKKSFSPLFDSGKEEAFFLQKLAEKNHWNFIYKPHPGIYSYRREMFPRSFCDKVIFIEKMNINKVIEVSDVIVNNISSCGYIALIEEKPVVETGKTTYYGSGCTYEVKKIDDLEQYIKEAICNGYTMDMKQAFIYHVALLLKYYLYSDGFDEECNYGKELPDSIEGFDFLKEMENYL